MWYSSILITFLLCAGTMMCLTNGTPPGGSPPGTPRQPAPANSGPTTTSGHGSGSAPPTTATPKSGTGPPAPVNPMPGSGGPGQGKPRGPPPGYSTALETELETSLFSSYSRNQRPQRKVMIKVSLNLMSINYLDIKAQSLSTSVYFALDWFDTRLRWFQNENYTNIPFLFSSETQMWRPAIIIENSVDDIDVISRPNVPLRIIEIGRVIWTPGGVYVTHCESDITYYPLDTQECDIILSTWAYTANEVFLELADKPIGLDFFKEHGEWDLIKTSASQETTKRESWSFSRLKFTITIRRRPLFHLLNTLFPVVLMAFLTVIVFKLPPESGERVGLSLTILLAFAVYLTLISDSIPQTSLSASLLSTYLASILLLQTVAVILTVIVLDIYFTSDDTAVPGWLKSFTRCLRTGTSCSCCRSRRSPVITPEPETEYSDVSPNIRFAGRMHEKEHDIDTVSLSSIPQRPLNSGGWAASSCSHSRDKITWKEAARVFDKFFLFLYLFAVCVISAACMGIMWSHNSSA